MEIVTSVSLLYILLFSINNTILLKCFLLTIISGAVNDMLLDTRKFIRSF